MAQSKARTTRSKRVGKRKSAAKKRTHAPERTSDAVADLSTNQTPTPAPNENAADVDPRTSHAQEDEAFRANQEVTEEGGDERDRFPD